MSDFKNLSFEVSGPSHPVPDSELLEAEATLGCRFPEDYRDFIRAFGAGCFDLVSLRVFSPAHIVKTTEADRERFREYWFWDASPEVWTQAQACRSIACFDSGGGHDIRFSPDDPSAIYLLPHGDPWIKRVTSFAELVDLLREMEPNDDDDDEDDRPTHETFHPYE